MVDYIKQLLKSIYKPKISQKEIEAGVKHSIDMYYNTYKLLEKYDKQSKKDASLLADPENLRKYFRSVLGEDSVRRTHPTL